MTASRKLRVIAAGCSLAFAAVFGYAAVRRQKEARLLEVALAQLQGDGALLEVAPAPTHKVGPLVEVAVRGERLSATGARSLVAAGYVSYLRIDGPIAPPAAGVLEREFTRGTNDEQKSRWTRRRGKS